MPAVTLATSDTNHQQTYKKDAGRQDWYVAAVAINAASAFAVTCTEGYSRHAVRSYAD